MVRTKFMLKEVRQHQYSHHGRTLVFRPQYDHSVPEDQRFAQETPTGYFEMFVDNPVALAQLELGKQYYVDISPA